MTSNSFRPLWRKSVLYSVAFPALFLPVDAWTQTAPASRDLEPVVVTSPSPPAASKRRAADRRAASSARVRQQRAAAASAPTPSVTSPLAAPTLNLTGATSTGSRLNLTRMQTPASVEIVTAETIAERGQHNVLDAVAQNATGFTASPAPGNGSLSFATRGFAGNGTVMTLYDGTRFYVGSGTLTFPYDSWSAQRIEVLRGPASVMYGEGAIGGAINVVSKMPLTVERNEAEVSIDSNLTRRLAVDSGGPVNKDVSYRVTAIGNMSDGWVDRDKTANVALSAAVRVQARDNLAITFSNDYGDRKPSRYFGTPPINGKLDESLRFKNYNVLDSDIRYRDNWTQIKTDWDVTDGISVHNVAYYLTSNRHWKDAESYAYNPATNLINRTSYIEIIHDQEQLGNRMDATFRGHVLGMKNEFVAGFDVNRINFSHVNNSNSASTYGGSSTVDLAVSDPGAFASPYALLPHWSSTTNQYGAFAENRLALTDQLSVVGGIRSDQPTVNRVDAFSSANTFEKTYSALSWRGGVVYNPIKDVSLYAQYATAVDPVSNLISMSGANKDFQLSTGKQTEIGVKHSFAGGRGEWTIAGYQIVKNNLLARDPLNVSSTIPLQIGQQSSRGIEATAGLMLTDKLRVDANIALLRAKYDDFTQVVSGSVVNYAGNVPVNVPQRVSNVWVTWDFLQSWSINAGVQMVGETFSDNANTFSRPAYNVVNGGLRWKPDANTTLGLRVYNLFDTIYATGGPTTQWLLGMPRTAELSLNVKF